MDAIQVTFLGLVLAILLVAVTPADHRDEMIEAAHMRAKKHRDWHYKDLESECTKNAQCMHTGFCDVKKGMCCSPHGFACISQENCCNEKHICGGKYAKSCINPPKPGR